MRRAAIPHRDEIEALVLTGASNGAIVVSLGVPHADVARIRKIMREGARQAAQRAAGTKRVRSPEEIERKRAQDRAASLRRAGKRHDVRAAALSEESLYRKTAMQRRARVLEMLAEGKTQAEMARELDVGPTTIGEIVASLEGRRSWRRQASVQVLVDRETKRRIGERFGRGEVSGWIAGLITAELDRLDAAG